jgi:REP element-mobilizing transposase RayT
MPRFPPIPSRLQDPGLRSADSRGRPSPHICPMPQAFYRRQLPHLQCDDKPHFVTFCTHHRWVLPEHLRSIVMDCCLHDNGRKFDLRAAVVMPDHVHMIFTPLISRRAMEVCSLAEIMDAIKETSAHKINKAVGRKGRVWQPESFDHVVRSSEGLDAKIQYLMENPVRRRLVARWTDYPWLWKKTFVNPYACVP